MSAIRNACLLLLVLLAASACGKTKRNQCNTIQAKASLEMKASEQIVTRLNNPGALAEHAKLLNKTADDLSGLEIEDANLKNAVANYLKALRGLAQGYHKASAGAQALGQGDLEKSSGAHLGAGSDMIVYGTLLSSSRKRIAEVCSKP